MSDAPLNALQELLNQLKELRRAAGVKRYHTFPIIGEQTVGHHTLNMLVMLFLLHPEPDIELVKAIVLHDFAEHILGDAPSPGLRQHSLYRRVYEIAQSKILPRYKPLQSELTQGERHWLDALDRLEAYFFAHDQYQLGNKNALEILFNLVALFREGSVPEKIREIIDLNEAAEERDESGR